MNDYLPLLLAVAPVFVTIGAGWGIRRAGWLTEEADASLLRVAAKRISRACKTKPSIS